MIAINHMCLLNLKYLKLNKIEKSGFSVSVPTSQILKPQNMWLVAIVLDSVEEHFIHYRKFFWAVVHRGIV